MTQGWEGWRAFREEARFLEHGLQLLGDILISGVHSVLHRVEQILIIRLRRRERESQVEGRGATPCKTGDKHLQHAHWRALSPWRLVEVELSLQFALLWEHQWPLHYGGW